MRPALILTAAITALTAAPAFSQPLTTAFTYQGELADSGSPVTGTYDLQFALFTDASGTTQVGPTLCADNVSVTGGRFAVELDFGALFQGQQRHLEVRVRPDTGLDCSSSAGLTTLSPRASLTAAPNAAFALTAATASSAATATNATQLNGQPAAFYTNASNFTSGVLPNARTTGTSFNTPGTLVLRDASGNISAQTVTGSSFVGFGGNLTGLNAGNITAGTIDNSRTSGTPINAPNTLVLRNSSGGFDAGAISATTIAGSGAAITNLNASNIASGTLAPARGGTGLSNQLPASSGQYLRSTAAGVWGIGTIAATDLPALAGDVTGAVGATSVTRLRGTTISSTPPSTNQVLTFNGSQWAPQTPAAPPAYTAGQGLALSGTTFSVPNNAITSGLLASDPLSLSRVSGSLLSVSSGNIGFNETTPEAQLHITNASGAAGIILEADAGSATTAALTLREDLATPGGGRLAYDTISNTLRLGTFLGTTETPAISIPRGSTDVTFAGDLYVPTTTRSLNISASSLSLNPGAVLTLANTPNGLLPQIIPNAPGGTGLAIGQITLPHNAVITQFEVFIQGGAGPNVTAQLHRDSLSGPSSTTMATLISDGSGPYVTTSIATPVVDNNNYAYLVWFQFPLNGTSYMSILGAKVTYTINTVSP
ncbi:MAG TPA: hypothetical protein VD997_06985 [Phycisphaerales bacterium]|nr:hypothetical protein [Phycisphaerales bacterium]